MGVLQTCGFEAGNSHQLCPGAFHFTPQILRQLFPISAPLRKSNFNQKSNHTAIRPTHVETYLLICFGTDAIDMYSVAALQNTKTESCTDALLHLEELSLVAS